MKRAHVAEARQTNNAAHLNPQCSFRRNENVTGIGIVTTCGGGKWKPERRPDGTSRPSVLFYAHHMRNYDEKRQRAMHMAA